MEIYYTDIREMDEKALFDKGLSLVNEDRRERVCSCRMERDRLRALCAGLLIRYACIKRGLSYDTLTFFRSDRGKPGVQGMEFNASHAGDYAVLAVSDDPVGIDVESFSERFFGARGSEHFLRVAQKTFHASELKQLKSYLFPDGQLNEQARTFAQQVWTRKESFAKACGAGLSMDFSKIDTTDTEGFASCLLPGGYTLSVYGRDADKKQIPICVHADEMLR